MFLIIDCSRKLGVTERKIVKYLTSLGIQVEDTYLSELTQDHYDLLVHHFSQEIKVIPQNVNILAKKYAINKHVYSNSDIVSFAREDMHLLSTRSKTIFENQLLPNILSGTKNIQSYLNYSDIIKLDHCGNKTAIEIATFIRELVCSINQNQRISFEKFGHIFNSQYFTIENIHNLFNLRQNELSKRSMNAYEFIKNSVKNDPKILFRFLDESEVLQIRNIGIGTVKEVVIFVENIIVNLSEIIGSRLDTNKHDNSILHQMQLKLGLKIENVDVNLSQIELYFYVLDQYLFSKINSVRDLNVLNDYYRGNKKHSMREIAKKMDICNERIRQIIKNKKAILRTSYLQFNALIEINNLLGSDEWDRHMYKPIKHFYHVDKLRLHSSLIGFAISDKQKGEIQNLDFSYFSKPCLDTVDLVSLYEQFQALTKRIERSYTIDFYEFFLKFLLTPKTTFNLDLISQEVLNMLIVHFNIKVDESGKIELVKNTFFKRSQLIEDILSEQGRPMHLNEISKATGISIDKIRGAVVRAKSIFILTGSSAYGLLKWDNTDNIKSGMIIDLIYEYLDQQPFPMHFFHIHQYIQKYRNTTEKSVRSLMEFSLNIRFLFFGAGFYGTIQKHKPFLDNFYNTLPSSWHLHLNSRFRNERLTQDELIKRDALKYNTNEIIVAAILKKWIIKKYIKVGLDGILIFTKYSKKKIK